MKRVLVLLFALSTLLCATARADVYDDNPAAVSVGPGNVWVFARGADGQILARHLSAGAWSDWSAVPGLAAGSGPGATLFGSTIHLFARGPDGALWENTYASGLWGDWLSLGGTIISAPSAGTRIGAATMDVAARGTNFALFTRTQVAGSPWNDWVDRGGNLGAAPTATGYTSTGTMDIFFRAGTGALNYVYSTSGTDFTAPSAFGGLLNGAPASVSPSVGQLDVYLRGGDDTLFRYRHPQDTGLQQIDQVTHLSSSPAATSDLPGREFLFARMGDGLSMMTVTNASSATPTYGPWQPLGPVAVPAPPVVVTPIVAPPPTIAPTVLVTLTPLLSYNFKSVTKKSTRFATLSVKNVPVGATVKVSCARGCTAKSLTKTNAPRTVSLTKFIKRAWKVGTTLTVIVSKPGTIASVKTLKIRAKKVPLLTSRCLPPGTTKPAACSAG